MIALENKTIVVWFSCGAASAVAAKKTIELYGKSNEIIVLNNPVVNEDLDNIRFLRDVEQWLERKILPCTNKDYPIPDIRKVFQKRKYMSGVKGAPCTMELKKRARQQWEQNNHFDAYVFGFTIEEMDRHQRVSRAEITPILPILIDLQLTKEACFSILSEQGIRLPKIYYKGFPNANCIGCVKATSPTYWNLVRKHYPIVFMDRMRQSKEIGCRLVRVKGKRVFLSELPAEATGRKLRKFKMPECGVICEQDINH